MKSRGWWPFTRTYMDTWADRLHHTWTSAILVLALIFLAIYHLFIGPIECRSPPNVQYRFITTGCWLQQSSINTNLGQQQFQQPNFGQPMQLQQQEGQGEAQYTLHVPFILMIMILCFNIPHWLWRFFSYNHGSSEPDDLVTFIKKADIHTTDAAKKGKSPPRFSQGWKKPGQQNARGCADIVTCFYPRLRRGILIWLYIIYKILNLCNVCIQFGVLNAIFIEGFMDSISETISQIYQDGVLPDNDLYPTMMMCQLPIQQATSAMMYQIQCFVPINFYNKTILLLLFVWVMLLLVITCVDLIIWVCRVILYHCYRRWLRQQAGDDPILEETLHRHVMRQQVNPDSRPQVINLLADRLSPKTMAEISEITQHHATYDVDPQNFAGTDKVNNKILM